MRFIEWFLRLLRGPNEARIKAEMSVASAQGFCSAASLTEYIARS